MATTATYNLGATGSSQQVSQLAVTPGRITQMAGVNLTGHFGVASAVTDVQEMQLTTTSATTVTSFTAPVAGGYLVLVYFRVSTAATNVNITVNYQDATGAQTYTAVANASYAVDSYTGVPIYIRSAQGGVMSVTATAGTANNVYVSATILGI